MLIFNVLCKFLEHCLLPPSAMPPSRISKSVSKKRVKEYAKEIMYVEKKERTGAVGFVAVDVPTVSMSNSTSPSTSHSQHSSLAPELHKMVIDDGEPSSKTNRPSKKFHKSAKVCCPKLYTSTADPIIPLRLVTTHCLAG
jgi:hypothetical protein